jgi:DNA-directed RNA polymerase sigma subunit (sigma70/sigma32)
LPEPTPQSKQSKSQAQKQLQLAEARYPRPHTLRGRTLTRLKGINEFLETIYGEPRLISDILRAEGIEEERTQLIKRHHLEEYLDKFVDGLSEVLDNPKWGRLLEIVRYRYGIAGGEKMSLQAIGDIYGLSRERIRQLQNKAIRIMKNSKRKAKLENMAMNVAKEVLGQDN